MPQDLSSLWNFSRRLYRQPNVETWCLTVQEQWQGNVNLLLWLRWMETLSVPIDTHRLALAEAYIADWHQDAVLPLRHLRTRIKARYGVENQAISRTREAIKHAELDAERAIQERLERLTKAWLAEEKRRPVAPGANVKVYTHQLGVPPALTRELIGCLCGAP